MKTTRLLTIIILSFLFLVLVSVYLLSVTISSRNQILLKNNLADAKTDSRQLLDFTEKKISNYVFDNSYWDELVTAVNNKNTNWIDVTIAEGLHKFDVDYFWVANEKMDFFYKGKSINTKNQVDLLLDDTEKKLITQSPFRHYYKKMGNDIMEIFVAPIHPTNDVERKTAARGYYVAGVVVNNAYIEKLNKLASGFEYAIAGPGSVTGEAIDAKTGNIAFTQKLVDLQNNTVGLLAINRADKAISSYQGYLKIYFFLFTLFIAIVAIFLYWVFYKKMLHPLNLISHSLATKSHAPIEVMKKQQNEFGEIASLISVSFDQTKLLQDEIQIRKQSEKALQTAVKEIEESTVQKIKAQEANAAKSEFLSTMSHEIRTPINGVIGVTKLMMEEDLSPRQKEYINILDFTTQHLQSLVSDILDFSKIEAGSVEFVKGSFNLTETCNHIYQLFKAKAAEKNLGFNFYTDKAAGDVFLYGDAVRLSQILSNLVSNAVKFTATGAVDFYVKLISENKNQATFEFIVKDTGIGISQADQQKIFESFSQANSHISPQYGGSGLGLTISKKLAEMMGGSIQVESNPGKGSTFKCYLSFDKHSFTDVHNTQPAKKNGSKDLSGLRVLIAEDNKVNAMVLTRFLEKWNVQSKLAENGKIATEMLNDEVFDLVLMDLHMPEMDGREAAKIIRSSTNKKVKNIPIVALTADALMNTKEFLQQNGFNHYLFKPFNPDILNRLLKKIYSETYEN
jgi:signal transduction histidine kinase/ActR/RegA family two-component response regulator